MTNIFIKILLQREESLFGVIKSGHFLSLNRSSIRFHDDMQVPWPMYTNIKSIFEDFIAYQKYVHFFVAKKIPHTTGKICTVLIEITH